jgi:hypothetical protein
MKLISKYFSLSARRVKISSSSMVFLLLEVLVEEKSNCWVNDGKLNFSYDFSVSIHIVMNENIVTLFMKCSMPSLG